MAYGSNKSLVRGVAAACLLVAISAASAQDPQTVVGEQPAKANAAERAQLEAQRVLLEQRVERLQREIETLRRQLELDPERAPAAPARGVEIVRDGVLLTSAPEPSR